MRTRPSQKLAMALLSLSTLSAFHVVPLPITRAQVVTFTNPAPANGDYFGWSVVAVGTDRVLIGAPRVDTSAFDAGQAYLFSTNGALLNWFVNPTPASGDEFGYSVAGVGTDLVLIGARHDDTGASDAGAAYLFTTSGVLLTTITNPTPEYRGYFGQSVAAVGTDRVLIGASGDNTGATHAGAAYLFSTSGVLLTTITNPTPAYHEYFGWSVAAVGTDRVLISAVYDDLAGESAGAAYLFSTSGVLLTSITNPTSAVDVFGCSVAAVGTDRVLIGAYREDTGAEDAGVAYLFSNDGTLLNTFTNPTPMASEYFGWSVSGVGSDRVLIGSLLDEVVEGSAGAAYLFSTDGTLLTNFSTGSHGFGQSVAALGTDRVLVGAREASTGAAQTGAAYLFSVPTASTLTLIVRLTTTNTVAISWPSPSTGWTLQQNSNSVGSVNWSNILSGIADDGTTKTLIVNPPTGNRFYRLHQP